MIEPRKPLEIVDVKIPDRLEHGAILVKTLAATICGTDVHFWEGEAGSSSGGPRILGHEMVGRVVQLGPGVTADSLGAQLAEGDRIIWAHGYCGQCYECVVEKPPTVCTGNPLIYMSLPSTEYPYLTGGFAEYCYVFPRSGRVKVPDTVSDLNASAAACALRTVVHAFDRLGGLDDRHSVVVQGSGPLGLYSVAKAVAGGASTVIAIGGPAARLEIAKGWGATHTIDIGEVTDPAQRAALVRELTGGKGPDVVVEVSGGHTALHRRTRHGPPRRPLPGGRADPPTHRHAQAIRHRDEARADHWYGRRQH
jgi:L-iditol 2-dehydrogenase